MNITFFFLLIKKDKQSLNHAMCIHPSSSRKKNEISKDKRILWGERKDNAYMSTRVLCSIGCSIRNYNKW